jgi:glycosyltransferase involved in cell wall biosynthesis
VRQVSRPPVLAYLVTEDWYFVSHRLPMARAARDAGYEVHVLTHVREHGAAIRNENFHLHPLEWRRGSTNPADLLSIIRQVRRLYKTLRPDLAHHVALQPALIGSLAALSMPIMSLNALAGLGYAFTSKGTKARMMRFVLSSLLRGLLNRKRAAVLVQNPDDRAVMQGLGIDPKKIFLIPGSGIDTDWLLPLPEPVGHITIAYVGRLLEDKGLRTLLAASALLTDLGRPVRVLIAGDPDAANPSSIPGKEIDSWRARSDLVLLGHVADIRQVWAAAHIAVLPSRREGLPKSLLEAAACGRPLIASDVPGCREIVRPGVNGLLVPADDAAAFADAIGRLAMDGDLRRKFSIAGRRLVEEEYSSELIGRKIVALYDRLIGRAMTGASRDRR